MIEADPETLMRQAWKTASEYMLYGEQEIDARFGKGFAKAHPELLAAFMRTAAADYGASLIAKEIGNAINDLSAAVQVYIGEALSELRGALESEEP